jgi:hypothetical protein
MSRQATVNSTTERACQRCLGTGRRPYEPRRRCSHCAGRGAIPAPDSSGIERAIVTRRGGQAGLRRSPPPHFNATLEQVRAYYVWRCARFHGGVDVQLPMTAELVADGDPYLPELEQLAQELARRYFGRDWGAVLRWMPLLGLPR